MASRSGTSERVLVVAPTGSDAANISRVLEKAGLHPCSCSGMREAAAELVEGAGAIVVTEEALASKQNKILASALDAQPPWSDVPVVIVSSSGSIHHWATASGEVLGSRSNVTLVTRPLRSATLIAAINAALRARRRQYQLRDLLRERDALLGSLEERVRERTIKLQELVAELESFSYSVSHDLRAPLRVMAGYAQVILDDFNSTLVPEVRNFVERIARSADRMDRLTQDVLAYTRLSRAEIQLEPIDLEIMVREIIEQYPALAASGTAISIRRPLAAVMAHGPSLAQALSNLIENALKFARPDVAPKVQIATKIHGDRVRILVKDNGIGIDPAHQTKIFRIFERVADHQVPGTGIGLAIVKKAAERMFGTVGVVSRKKTGSEFWIELARVPRQRLARSEENAAGGGS